MNYSLQPEAFGDLGTLPKFTFWLWLIIAVGLGIGPAEGTPVRSYEEFRFTK